MGMIAWDGGDLALHLVIIMVVATLIGWLAYTVVMAIVGPALNQFFNGNERQDNERPLR